MHSDLQKLNPKMDPEMAPEVTSKINPKMDRRIRPARSPKIFRKRCSEIFGKGLLKLGPQIGRRRSPHIEKRNV